jgi:hypothetical protein
VLYIERINLTADESKTNSGGWSKAFMVRPFGALQFSAGVVLARG